MRHFDPDITSRDLNRLLAVARDPSVLNTVLVRLSSAHAQNVAKALADPASAISAEDTRLHSDVADIRSFIVP
jgi:hypothetical protein